MSDRYSTIFKSVIGVGAAGILAAYLSGPTSAQTADTPQPDNVKTEEIERLNAIIKQLQKQAHPHRTLGEAVCGSFKSGKKYVYLGDSNHGARDVRGAAFSAEVLAAIARCSPNAAYVLESPPGTAERLQQDAARWLDKMDDKNAKSLSPGNDRLRQFAMMKILGVAPAYYDPGYKLDKEAKKTADILTGSYVSNPHCQAVSLIYNVQAKAENPQIFWTSLSTLLDNRLSSDNDVIASEIIKNHQTGATIFYGSGHMDGAHDLDELTGESESVWIDIQSDQDISASHEGQRLRKLYSRGDAQDRPEYVYFAQQQELVRRDDLPAGYFDRVERLSEKDFQACKAALPDNVRNAFTKQGSADFTYKDFRVLQDPDQPLPEIIRHWRAPQP